MNEAVRTSRVLAERQSVVLGESSVPLCILDAGTPGETVHWLPPSVGKGRVDKGLQAIGEDGSVQADFLPYAPGEAEVVCMIGGDPARTFTFRITIEPNPEAPKTMRPSMIERPSGVPASWVSEIPVARPDFTDDDIEQLFEPIGKTSYRPPQFPSPEDEPLREALPPPKVTVVAKPAAKAATPPLADLVEFAPTAPSPRVIGAPVPQEPPLTPTERKSISGGRGRRFLRSWPMLAAITAVIMVACLSVIGILSSSMMNEREALEEATRRDMRLHREARSLLRSKVSAQAATPDRKEPVVDFDCSNAPIRRNADGTYEMEVCID